MSGPHVDVGPVTPMEGEDPAEELARLRERDIDLPDGEQITTWDITPRGRLALLCHQAVTAGMVSS